MKTKTQVNAGAYKPDTDKTEDLNQIDNSVYSPELNVQKESLIYIINYLQSRSEENVSWVLESEKIRMYPLQIIEALVALSKFALKNKKVSNKGRKLALKTNRSALVLSSIDKYNVRVYEGGNHKNLAESFFNLRDCLAASNQGIKKKKSLIGKTFKVSNMPVKIVKAIKGLNKLVKCAEDPDKFKKALKKYTNKYGYIFDETLYYNYMNVF